MTAAEVTIIMTAAEARIRIEEINQRVGDVRVLLLDLHDREGWRVLGYGSWRECVETEFEESRSYLYRLLSAAQIEKRIEAAEVKTVSPRGDKHIPEKQLRPLAKLPEGKQAAAWQEAIATAPDGKLTAAHITSVSERWAGKVTRREEVPAPFVHVSGPIPKPTSNRRSQAELPLRHCPTCTCEMEPAEPGADE